MSEERDEETGQFKPSEQLFGLKAAEAEAGYVHLPPEEPEEELTVAEAAERLQSNTPEEDVVTHSPLELPENLAMTVEEAAKIHGDREHADRLQAEQDEIKRTQEEVDELRGVKEETPPAPEPAFDPEKALEHPQIKEAIEKVTAETEAARVNHVNGLAAATQIAEASFFNQFPEFANVPPEGRMEAFMAIMQNEPERASQIRASVDGIAKLFGNYNEESGRLQNEQQQKFSNYAKSESDKFEALVKGTPKADRLAIEKHIGEAIKEYGGNTDEFFQLMKTPQFASATAQMLLWEVGKSRMKAEALKSVSLPRPERPIPPVLRPGVAAPRGAAGAASIQALTSRLSASGSVDDAFALYQARQRGRGSNQ